MAVERRRRRHRRAEDRQLSALAQHRPSSTVKRAAVGLLCVVCIVLGVAVVALVLEARNDRQALSHSENALARSETALRSAQLALRSAQRAAAQSVQTQQLAAAIQASRVANCRAQNRRHGNTVKALDKLITKNLRRVHAPQLRREIAASRASTILLINALAPKQSCSQTAGARP